MAFCGNCGTMVQDNVKFCPSCGMATAAPAQAAAVSEPMPPVQPIQPVAPASAAPPAQPGGYAQQQPAYTPPVMPGAPGEADIRDAQDNKGMAILSYILFFIPLLTGAHKTSPFVKFHVNQGTVLFLATLAFGVVYWIITAILTAILFSTGAWGVWSVLSTILGLLWLLPAILTVVGIINAAGGKYKALPIIGKFTIIK